MRLTYGGKAMNDQLSDELARWRADYVNVLQSIETDNERFGAQPRTLPAGAERRKDPRFAIPGEAKVYVHLKPRAFLLDNISIGGMAFYSDMPFEPGHTITLSAMGALAIDAEVVRCEMIETREDIMEYQYLVRARFQPSVNGYQAFVLALEVVENTLREAQDKPNA